MKRDLLFKNQAIYRLAHADMDVLNIKRDPRIAEKSLYITKKDLCIMKTSPLHTLPPWIRTFVICHENERPVHFEKRPVYYGKSPLYYEKEPCVDPSVDVYVCVDHEKRALCSI